MNYALYQILMPLTAGGLIGALYFSGLWQTVQRLPAAARPLRVMAVSFLGRLVLALGGFYLLMNGTWERPAAAMVGFLIIRAIMLKTLGRVPAASPKGATAWKS